VLAALALAYAYPIRVYLEQRADIARLAAAQDQQQKRINALAEERKKWDDPEYVKTQARKRLLWVLPDETAYLVVDPGVPPDRGGTQKPATKPDSSWYGKLDASIRSANRK